VTRDDENPAPEDWQVVGRWHAQSFVVGHTALEFKVDCGRDPDEAMTVFFRIVASPSNARQLFRELGISLLRYADKYGPIGDPDTH
jgi:hypothetical protein